MDSLKHLPLPEKRNQWPPPAVGSVTPDGVVAYRKILKEKRRAAAEISYTGTGPLCFSHFQ